MSSSIFISVRNILWGLAESQSQLLLWSDSCSIINLQSYHRMKYIDLGIQLGYKYLILCFFKAS